MFELRLVQLKIKRLQLYQVVSLIRILKTNPLVVNWKLKKRAEKIIFLYTFLNQWIKFGLNLRAQSIPQTHSTNWNANSCQCWSSKMYLEIKLSSQVVNPFSVTKHLLYITWQKPVSCCKHNQCNFVFNKVHEFHDMGL